MDNRRIPNHWRRTLFAKGPQAFFQFFGAWTRLARAVAAEWNKIIYAGATATIDVTDDNVLIAGGSYGGWLTNNGTVRMTASPQLSDGVYRPIHVDPMPGGGPEMWDGSGVYKAIGGTWDGSSHTFTVGSAVQTTPGTTTQIDLTAYQRVDVGTELSLSFESGSETLDFMAEKTSSTNLAVLLGLLTEGEAVVDSWDFTIDGIADGRQTMLSYAVTGDPSEMRTWHYDSTTGWTQYTGSPIHYDNGRVSFTVGSFSSYAVTGVGVPVPEPSMAILLAMAAGGLGLLRRRREKV